MRSPLALLLVLALSATLAADSPPSTQYVTLEGTRLLATPAAFGRSLAKLHKGQSLQAWPAKGGYVKVSLSLGGVGKMGFVALRSLQDHRPKLGAGAVASGDASAQEVAAATKGFNSQVEAKLRSGDVKGGYARLDQGLARTGMADPVASLEGWRREGRLGEFQGLGQ